MILGLVPKYLKSLQRLDGGPSSEGRPAGQPLSLSSRELTWSGRALLKGRARVCFRQHQRLCRARTPAARVPAEVAHSPLRPVLPKVV